MIFTEGMVGVRGYEKGCSPQNVEFVGIAG
jgi:hypothetical protein